MSWFYDNFTPPAFAQMGGAQGETEIGLRFTVSVDQAVLALRWFRVDATAGIAPEILRVWRESDLMEVCRATAVSDDGAAGWQTCAVAAGTTLTAGEHYVVAGAFQNLKGWPEHDDFLASAPPAPFVADTVERAYHTPIGAWGYPQNQDSAGYVGVDVEISSGGGGGGGDGGTGGTTGVGDPVLTGDVAVWLSNDPAVNLHQADGLPWQTQAGLAALGLTVGARSGRVLSLGSLVLAVDYLISHADDILGAINQFRQLVGGDAGSLGDLQTALAGTESRLSDLINANSTRGFPPFPGAPWSMADSIDFDTSVAWDVPADLYVVNLSEYVPVRSISETAAGTWLHRLGWWCPLRGSLASTRHFYEFQQQYLEDGGRRMQGMALQCERGTLGTVQAWLLA